MASYEEAKWIANALFKSFVGLANLQDESSLENILGEIDCAKSYENLEMLTEASNFCTVASIMVESDIRDKQQNP